MSHAMHTPATQTPATQENPPEDTLTIHFFGLCMFARSGRAETEPIHVFLAQPQNIPPMSHGAPHDTAHDMVHVSTLCSRKGPNKWSARRIPSDRTLEYGIRGGNVILPSEQEMSNVSRMPEGGELPDSEAKPGGVNGAQVILHGGTLSVREEIGIWTVPDGTGCQKLCYFPYLVDWVGPVDLNQPNGELMIWNAIAEESPKVGDDSEPPPHKPIDDDAIKKAADHFRAYYHILAKKDGPTIKFEGTKKPPIGTKKSAKSSLVPFVSEDIKSLIVSSCPSALASLNP